MLLLSIDSFGKKVLRWGRLLYLFLMAVLILGITFPAQADVDPMDNWSEMALGDTEDLLHNVAYGSGAFVALEWTGTIWSSPDGSNWTIRAVGDMGHLSNIIHGSPTPPALLPGGQPTARHLFGITYGNGIFVAVGENGVILTSRDGLNWTSRTSGTKNWLQGVAYGNGTFVVVGMEGTILRSGAVSSNMENSLEITLWIGKPHMLVNSVSKEIDPGRGTVPLIVDNRTLMPIRAIVEELGGEINWDRTEEKVSIQLKGTVIDLWIGKNTARINGVETTMDVAPMLMNDRTILPLRSISENLGCQANWDDNTRKVTVKP